jgi:hypothetical protein
VCARARDVQALLGIDADDCADERIREEEDGPAYRSVDV